MKPQRKLDGDPAPGPAHVEARQRDRLLTVRTVAGWLNVTPRKIYLLAADGAFKAVKIGAALRIFESSVHDYLEREIFRFELETGNTLSDRE